MLCPRECFSHYHAPQVFSRISRYRNVTICPRVQVFSGLNVVSLVPFVIPFVTAQRTALSYYAPDETSRKGFLPPETAGEPLARNRNVTICPRVQVFSGLKVVLLVPAVTLFSAAHWTAFS